ncbi:MAG: hypothetical protein ACR2PC_16455 [Tsuneonella suprasediminis]|uniref:Uncharacterized protein n=1 Tax=Tsuneonella suprasediminis TaxID=2306996 RepID=A0A419R5S1_9SPHN|nr:hypothetical protein [Tsuneonella suprasediminis]RJX71242.1 hypothetical protein D6858_01025 [Tsuneonella suprasediminis]UBS34493.1 hypothetical protein LBX01_07850 [Altererythrobacter sp. N1]
MADLFDLIDSAFGEDLWLAVIGVGTILAYTIGKHARHKFLRWRLNRQLARSNYILANELRDYQQRIGDDPEPIDRAKTAQGVAIHMSQIAAPAALGYAISDDHWKTTLAAIAIVAAYYGWRWINDPPEHRPQLLRQSLDATIPKEAILGAIGSVAIVAILLTLMLTL